MIIWLIITSTNRIYLYVRDEGLAMPMKQLQMSPLHLRLWDNCRTLLLATRSLTAFFTPIAFSLHGRLQKVPFVSERGRQSKARTRTVPDANRCATVFRCHRLNECFGHRVKAYNIHLHFHAACALELCVVPSGPQPKPLKFLQAIQPSVVHTVETLSVQNDFQPKKIIF